MSTSTIPACCADLGGVAVYTYEGDDQAIYRTVYGTWQRGPRTCPTCGRTPFVYSEMHCAGTEPPAGWPGRREWRAQEARRAQEAAQGFYAPRRFWGDPL